MPGCRRSWRSAGALGSTRATASASTGTACMVPAAPPNAKRPGGAGPGEPRAQNAGAQVAASRPAVRPALGRPGPPSPAPQLRPAPRPAHTELGDHPQLPAPPARPCQGRGARHAHALPGPPTPRTPSPSPPPVPASACCWIPPPKAPRTPLAAWAPPPPAPACPPARPPCALDQPTGPSPRPDAPPVRPGPSAHFEAELGAPSWGALRSWESLYPSSGHPKHHSQGAHRHARECAPRSRPAPWLSGAPGSLRFRNAGHQAGSKNWSFLPGIPVARRPTWPSQRVAIPGPGLQGVSRSELSLKSSTHPPPKPILICPLWGLGPGECPGVARVPSLPHKPRL